MAHPGRSFLLAAGLAVALASFPVLASADGFTPAQRQEIIAVVREALKTDPSILGDAILSLRAQEERAQAGASAVALRQNQGALAGQPGDFIAGNPRGDVTLVEFYDPRCPYCRKSLPELDALVAGDRKLRVVEKLIPILGPDSLLQARAIAAAGKQDKYAALQHALMGLSGASDLEQIRAVAGRSGIDVGRLDRDMANPAIEAQLRAGVALARTLGINGTPSFVIGDKIIPGAVSLDELRQTVTAARSG